MNEIQAPMVLSPKNPPIDCIPFNTESNHNSLVFSGYRTTSSVQRHTKIPSPILLIQSILVAAPPASRSDPKPIALPSSPSLFVLVIIAFVRAAYALNHTSRARSIRTYTRAVNQVPSNTSRTRQTHALRPHHADVRPICGRVASPRPPDDIDKASARRPPSYTSATPVHRCGRIRTRVPSATFFHRPRRTQSIQRP